MTDRERASLLERFLRYVKIWTTSNSDAADSGIQPSTERQWDFAKILASELTLNGAQQVTITDNCYVRGILPATKGLENVPSICLMAHMDTVEEVSGENVQPQVHTAYNGNRIELKDGIVLDPSEDAALAQAGANGETVITTDGTTLLGADDKAGVAAIMTSVAYLNEHPEVAHGPIEIMYSPDEETGHGMDHVPLDLLVSKCAYTVDGGHIGELETECFNAYKSDVTFTGKALHTGSARPGMVNAVTMAGAFISMLPRHEAPETTDGYMGFYAPMSMSGSMESASVCLFLRDFTEEGMEKRKALVEQLAQVTAASFGGKAQVQHTAQYKNMKAGLEKAPHVTQNLVQAYKAAGVEPVFQPIRGGTDGSRLTEMGIPTPNIFTGGHNYHSRREWCSLEQMAKAAEVLLQLSVITANSGKEKN
ncbi:MAG: peptidase T [Treponema sp.]|nr:peptidase T [Treponema sp.]